MFDRRITIPAASAAPAIARRDTLVIVGLSLLLVALIVIASPRGYAGGGADDWYYLQAARCAAEHGFCIPPDHWWARWPLVLEIAATLSLFGESRLVLVLLSACHAVAAATLLGLLVRRAGGLVAGLVAVALLLSTQVLAAAATSINIDIVELSLLLGTAFALERGLRRDALASSFVAGLLLAIAVQSRTTALALGLPVAVVMLMNPRRRFTHIGIALAGFVLPLAAEMLAYGLSTGDPLRGWKLALGHTRIPSRALAAGVDLSESPLFNPHFISGWHPAAGIDAHWTIRPIVNLLAAPEIARTFWLALLLKLVARGVPRRRLGWALLALLVYNIVILSYGFAIDPQPRMFFVATAAAAAIGGLAAARVWAQGPRALVIMPLTMLFAAGLLGLAWVPDMGAVDTQANRWLSQQHGHVEVRDGSRRFLALANLPPTLSPEKAQALLIIAPGGCPARPPDRMEHWPLTLNYPAPPLGIGRLLAAVGRTPATPSLCGYAAAPDPRG